MTACWKVEAVLRHVDEEVDWIEQKKNQKFSVHVAKWFPLSANQDIIVRVIHVPSGRAKIAKVRAFRRPNTILVQWDGAMLNLVDAINRLKEELKGAHERFIQTTQ
jgi:hypothetical protein